MQNPPTRAGLVVNYVIMLAVLVAAVAGSAVGVAVEAWGTAVCLPSGEPIESPGSVIALVVVLGTLLVCYCAGCAAYLWSIGAASVHSRVWLAITVLMVGLVIGELATPIAQSCR